jgi:hypothetical protein
MSIVYILRRLMFFYNLMWMISGYGILIPFEDQIIEGANLRMRLRVRFLTTLSF